jgi:TonB family protein
MTARSPSALLLSASLHGLIVAMVVLLAYLAQTQVKDAPKILELVAGEGDNYGATAAPALGTAGGVKIAMPEPPAPKPQPVKVEAPAPVTAPEPEPVVTKAPVQKAATPAPTKATEAKIPDLAKSVKRIEAKRRAKIEAKDRAAREAEQKRISKAEFDKQNKANKTAGASNPKVKHVDAEGIAGGVVGGSTANKVGGAGGKALTAEEHDLLDAYFAIVKQRLQDGLDKPPGLGDAVYAVAEFRLNADGSITGARITRASGSEEFDRAVIDALRRFKRVTPPSIWKGETTNLTFRMKEDEGG